MERQPVVTQLSLGSTLEPAEAISDSTVLECGSGGCRFGVWVSDVADTDVWVPDFLAPSPRYSESILGTLFYDGTSIPVVNLRQLFCPEEPLPNTDLMSIVVSYQSHLFVLLVDGFISLAPVSKESFRSFISLYVCGVKWLSGAFILEDRAIPMLDLPALFEWTRSAASTLDSPLS